MRENLYVRRYESSTGINNDASTPASHMVYRDSLKELCVRVLKFQATAVCYYSRIGTLRIGADMVKWDEWDTLLLDVKTQEGVFKASYELLKDEISQEESGMFIAPGDFAHL